MVNTRLAKIVFASKVLDKLFKFSAILYISLLDSSVRL